MKTSTQAVNSSVRDSFWYLILNLTLAWRKRKEEILKSKNISACVLSFIIECQCCLTLVPMQFPQSREKSRRTYFFQGQEKLGKFIFSQGNLRI